MVLSIIGLSHLMWLKKHQKRVFYKIVCYEGVSVRR